MAERLPFDAMQMAIFSRLTDATNGIGSTYKDADGNWKVYDHVPQDPPMPYVELGGFIGAEEGIKNRRTKEQTFSVHAVSDASGYRELNDLMNAIAQSVTAAEFGSLSDDFRVANGSIRISSFEVLKDYDADTGELFRHGILRVRVLVDDVST